MDRQCNWSSLDHSALVALAKSGDKAAFSELVQRYQSSLRSLLRRLSGDAELATDLSQQAFLSAWISLSDLNELGAFPVWLRAVAVNVWRKHCRHKNPLRNADDIDEAGESVLSALGDSVGEGMDLDRALSLLSADVRLCIVLCYHEGMSHRLITEATSIPLGTVKSHILRGSKILREFLSAYSDRESRR
jgi:RNA polymerase sigma factor (sigma-70 family)